MMKKTILVMTLTLAVNLIYSQDDMKTLFKKDTASKKENSYGGYGAPFVGVTELNKDVATIVGGKGGVIKNHNFVFGGVGAAIISSAKSVFDTIQKPNTTVKHSSTPGADDSLYVKQTLSMGYGGIFVEYIFNYSSPVHVSIPLNIAVGGVLGGGERSNIKSATVIVLEPGINFEFNFYKFFVPAINVGYRYVSGDYSSKLSGVYGTLILKFGKF